MRCLLPNSRSTTRRARFTRLTNDGRQLFIKISYLFRNSTALNVDQCIRVRAAAATAKSFQSLWVVTTNFAPMGSDHTERGACGGRLLRFEMVLSAIVEQGS